jgi:MFS-type transporter involved in bile tolerance (Atg22 family)
MFFLGFLSEAWAFYNRILGFSLNRSGWFYLGFFFIIMGVQFFISGVTLDLMLRNFFNSSPFEKRYYIRDVIEK